jgi:hypothetical protein
MENLDIKNYLRLKGDIKMKLLTILLLATTFYALAAAPPAPSVAPTTGLIKPTTAPTPVAGKTATAKPNSKYCYCTLAMGSQNTYEPVMIGLLTTEDCLKKNEGLGVHTMTVSSTDNIPFPSAPGGRIPAGTYGLTNCRSSDQLLP